MYLDTVSGKSFIMASVSPHVKWVVTGSLWGKCLRVKSDTIRTGLTQTKRLDRALLSSGYQFTSDLTEGGSGACRWSQSVKALGMSWVSPFSHGGSFLALSYVPSSNYVGCVFAPSWSSLITSKMGMGWGKKYPADAYGVN